MNIDFTFKKKKCIFSWFIFMENFKDIVVKIVNNLDVLGNLKRLEI